VVPEGFEPPTS